ncbi:hypothetical protein LCL97_11780 [Seohaeicola saemankumensis]|nr:hypothetical protein [Seohaeicola saemankumensis]MCA0871509.1 hypothetical protein [Seohaeicola saemankumensis]
MKTTIQCGLAALCMLTAAEVSAEGGPPQGRPPLPPGVMAQINLGKAGLLESFYSSEQFGTVQARIGQSRATIGAATAPFGPTTGFKDEDSALVVPLNLLKGLKDGKSYLRFSATGTFANGRPNLVELDGKIGRLDVQYLTFPNVDTMIGFGAFVERSDMDIVGAGTVDRDGAGLRFDIIRKFSAHWGVAARAEYSWGETDLQVAAGPGTMLRHVQGDDRFYAQAEFVGQFRKGDVAWVPQGWIMRPTLGVQFQRNSIEATADSFGVVSSGVIGPTEDYGTAWAYLKFEKEVRPGNWAPKFGFGIEHEYVNDLDIYVDEPTYAVMHLGLSRQMKSGSRFDFAFTRHQGLNGNRWNQSLVTALTIPF